MNCKHRRNPVAAPAKEAKAIATALMHDALPGDLTRQFGVTDGQALALYDLATQGFGPGGKGWAWVAKRADAILRKGGYKRMETSRGQWQKLDAGGRRNPAELKEGKWYRRGAAHYMHRGGHRFEVEPSYPTGYQVFVFALATGSPVFTGRASTLEEGKQIAEQAVPSKQNPRTRALLQQAILMREKLSRMDAAAADMWKPGWNERHDKAHAYRLRLAAVNQQLGQGMAETTAAWREWRKSRGFYENPRRHRRNPAATSKGLTTHQIAKFSNDAIMDTHRISTEQSSALHRVIDSYYGRSPASPEDFRAVAMWISDYLKSRPVLLGRTFLLKVAREFWKKAGVTGSAKLRKNSHGRGRRRNPTLSSLGEAPPSLDSLNLPSYSPQKHQDHPVGWKKAFGGDLADGQEFLYEVRIPGIGYAAGRRIFRKIDGAKAQSGNLATWVFGPAPVYVRESRRNPHITGFGPRRHGHTGREMSLSGEWARIAKKHYRHMSGVEVIYNHNRFLWCIRGGPHDGECYTALWVAKHEVERSS